MNRCLYSTAILFLAITSLEALADQCPEHGLYLQVLGSGDSSLQAERAGPGYLVWYQGHARILVDAGGGTAMRFRKSGARFADLDLALITQVDSAHTADMATMMASAISEKRTRPLPVFGPTASKTTPSTVSFIRSLFDEKRGAYRDLGPLVSPLGSRTFKLEPHNTRAVSSKPGKGIRSDKNKPAVFSNASIRVHNFRVGNNKEAKLGWIIQFANKKIIFTGDAQPGLKELDGMADDSDILVTHHAIPENGPGSDRNLFLPPSAIGTIAYKSRTKKLVLGHRMQITMGKEKESTDAIKSKYSGFIQFANDLDCIKP